MEPEETVEGPFIDVEDFITYISAYKGRTRVMRALYIANKAKGTPLELEALRVAHDTLKDETADLDMYQDVVKQIDGRLGANYYKDNYWMDRTEKQGAAQKERLDRELTQSKNTMAKDNIRLVHEKLADYYYNRGELNSAMKSYVRMRDYCTDSKSMLAMCLHVIRASLELNNLMHVTSHVQKAELLPEVTDDQVVVSKLKASAGLSALIQGKFRLAARRFSEVPADLGDQYNDVITSRDVAVYGTLCALATMDRTDLRINIINNVAFREFLELHVEVREAVSDFYASRYSSCLSALAALRPQLICDMYLGPHVDELYESVRSRALTQYSLPFTSVSLVSMASDFNTDVKGLEEELVKLIGKGQVQGRIDSLGQVMYARTANQRTTTFQAALQAGDKFIHEARALLIRASLVQSESAQKSGGGGGSSGNQSRGQRTGGGGGGRRNFNRGGPRRGFL